MSENIEKRYLNLVEQVRKNQLDIQGLSAGLKIVGYGPTVPADLQDGESFLKEEGDGYKLYIKVNGNALDMGEFPPKGPQGIPGPEGDPAVFPNVFESTSTLEPGTDAYVRIDYDREHDAMTFNFQIPQGPVGPRGPRGLAGPRGSIGPRGHDGPQGEPAYAVKIIGTVSNYTLLPTPSRVSRNAAYLVGASAPYHLYVIIGTDALSWMDAGGFEQTVIVTDNALNASSTNPIQNKPVAEQFNKLAAYLDISSYATPGNTLSADILSELEDDGVFFKGDYDAGSGVGYADQAGSLVDKTGETLESGVDDEPFGFRPTAYPFDHAKITVGNKATVKKIWAYAFVKNQLVVNGTFDNTNSWLTGGATDFSVSSHVATFTATETYGKIQQQKTLIAGHKYIAYAYIKATTATDKINLRIAVSGEEHAVYSASNTSWQFLSMAFTAVNSSNSFYLQIRDNRSSDWDAVQVKDVRLIDITQWFNNDATILSAISESWFVAWFLNSFGKFIPSAFNTGEIENQWATKIKTDGINLWDEEWDNAYYNESNNGLKVSNADSLCNKNPIRVYPGRTYYILGPSSKTLRVLWLDSDGNLISHQYMSFNNTVTAPNNAVMMNWYSYNSYGTTYNNDIQICNHWTETAVEQTYHAYESWVFNLDWSFVGEGNTPKGLTASLGDCKDYENGVNEVVVGSYKFTGSEIWTAFGSGYQTTIGSAAKTVLNSVAPIAVTDTDLPITNRDSIYSGGSGISLNGTTIYVSSTSGLTGKTVQYELATKITTSMSEAERLTNAYDCNDYGNEAMFNGDDESVACLDVLYQKNLSRQIVNNQDEIAAIKVYVKPLPPESADGTYIYKAVKSGSTITYGWVKEE